MGATWGRKGSRRGVPSWLRSPAWAKVVFPTNALCSHWHTSNHKWSCLIVSPTTPPALLAPRPTVLHSGFISSLWINRDTLSVQRRVVIKVFSYYPWVKKTSTPHFFIIDVLFRGGWNTFPIQVMLLFWGSCTTAPGVRHQPMPCNEVRDKAAFPRVSFSLIKLSMICFFRVWWMWWTVLWR